MEIRLYGVGQIRSHLYIKCIEDLPLGWEVEWKGCGRGKKFVIPVDLTMN